ncbi:mitochondrial amidoxime reducing component 2 isoform X2 [Macaca fascicularis]|uniref:mitochondrial amidoxime reducing component 2 isoform X2 n=1 Tax=Macaca fascicularis TaxID=9541 RepID=UPI003D1558AC
MGASSSSALARLGLPAQARPRWLGVAVLGLAAVALGAVAWRRAWPRRRRRLQQVGTVAKLWIYPVKSCKGVPVSEAECTAMGLRSGNLRDRFWLVIKEDGHMVTARQEPRLVLVSITYENNCLIFKAPDMDQLVLPSKQPSSNKLHNCSYRLCDPSERELYKLSPLFGIYYSVEKIGSLRVGDPVYRMV